MSPESVTKEGQITEPEPDLLTIDRTAQRLSLSAWTIRGYVRAGKLASVKIGRRVLIPTSEIYRLVGENLRPSVE